MEELGDALFFKPQQVLNNSEEITAIHGEHVFAALVEATRYVTETLTAPDPTLGRSGAVCPFVGAALRSDMITLSVLPSRTADLVALRDTALAIKRQFGSGPDGAASAADSLRAVMVLMPFLDTREAARLVETVQKDLKPEMVASGLMIGEFYPGCTLPGLNNPLFRPADTAFSCLAIRRMTAGDLPFLLEDAELVHAYLDRFGEEGRRRLLLARRATCPEGDVPDAGVVARSALLRANGGCPIHAG